MVCCEPIDIRYSDGYVAYARLWRPSDPRGTIVYLHGIQSHGLWFEASAQRIADAGFAVLMPDRRGSGRNDRDRGHTPSASRLLQDVSECGDELRLRTGLDRFHIVGVSWGGKLALAYTARLGDRVGSMTLIAPGLFPKVDLPRAQKVRVGLSALAGGRAMFDIPLQQAELFTENPERQAFIREDSLALRKVSATFLLASRKLDATALRVASMTSGPPLCLFLGGRDRIIDNDRTRQFVRRLPFADRRIIEYEQAHHTLEFERDPEPFLSELVRWVEHAHGRAAINEIPPT